MFSFFLGLCYANIHFERNERFAVITFLQSQRSVDCQSILGIIRLNGRSVQTIASVLPTNWFS